MIQSQRAARICRFVCNSGEANTARPTLGQPTILQPTLSQTCRSLHKASSIQAPQKVGSSRTTLSSKNTCASGAQSIVSNKRSKSSAKQWICDTVVFHFFSCHKCVNTQGMVVVVRLLTHDEHLSGRGMDQCQATRKTRDQFWTGLLVWQRATRHQNLTLFGGRFQHSRGQSKPPQISTDGARQSFPALRRVSVLQRFQHGLQ